MLHRRALLLAVGVVAAAAVVVVTNATGAVGARDGNSVRLGLSDSAAEACVAACKSEEFMRMLQCNSDCDLGAKGCRQYMFDCRKGAMEYTDDCVRRCPQGLATGLTRVTRASREDSNGVAPNPQCLSECATDADSLQAACHAQYDDIRLRSLLASCLTGARQQLARCNGTCGSRVGVAVAAAPSVTVEASSDAADSSVVVGGADTSQCLTSCWNTHQEHAADCARLGLTRPESGRQCAIQGDMKLAECRNRCQKVAVQRVPRSEIRSVCLKECNVEYEDCTSKILSFFQPGKCDAECDQCRDWCKQFSSDPQVTVGASVKRASLAAPADSLVGASVGESPTECRATCDRLYWDLKVNNKGEHLHCLDICPIWPWSSTSSRLRALLAVQANSNSLPQCGSFYGSCTGNRDGPCCKPYGPGASGYYCGTC